MTANIWIFDLDNTLHDASRHAFPIIDAAMTRYLQGNLQLDYADANELRQAYWRRYGATMLGLRRHHQHLNPHHFLAACHPLQHLREQIHPMPRLKATLSRLQGKKYLFTNGPFEYAEMMLLELGIQSYFSGIAAIDTVKLQPKPFASAYRAMLKQFHLKASDCIMVEDSIDNLLTAKRLGMQTIWLRQTHRNHPAADRVIQHFHQLAT